MMEQRYRAVLEVQAGVPVTEVAERFGVSAGAAVAAAGSRRERSGKARGRLPDLIAWRPGGPPLKMNGKFSLGGVLPDVARLSRPGTCLTLASHLMLDMITIRLLDHVLLRQREGLGAGIGTGGNVDRGTAVSSRSGGAGR